MTVTRNICIDQNTDFRKEFIYTANNVPYDITDCTFYASLKKNYSALMVYPFSIEKTNSEEGIFDLIMSKDITSTIPPGKYEFDILMVSNEEVTKICNGLAIVLETITNIIEEPE